ncbi:MAG: hypothetical protein AB1486_17885, partial [Planctomycetota bacterium]
MELLLYTLLITIATLESDVSSRRRMVCTGVLWCIAFGLRAEAPALYVGLAIAGSWRILRRQDRLRDWLWQGGVVAAGLASLLAFRLLYYGDVLPNPYYAKAPSESLWPGIAYILEFLSRSKLAYLFVLPVAYFIDYFGLCNREIALRRYHSGPPAHLSYLLSLRPDYIIVINEGGGLVKAGSPLGGGGG